MPYIKISDPSVIDIAAWHQVINVVNQHSDSINALTNNFGVAKAVPDYSAENYSYQYDPGSQKIIYGRAKITPTQAENNGTEWYGTITFSDDFGATPIVTATSYSGNTSNAVSTANDDVIVSVYNVSSTGFKYRIFRSGTTKLPAGTVYINWIAVGPQ